MPGLLDDLVLIGRPWLLLLYLRHPSLMQLVTLIAHGLHTSAQFVGDTRSRPSAARFKKAEFLVSPRALSCRGDAGECLSSLRLRHANAPALMSDRASSAAERLREPLT